MIRIRTPLATVAAVILVTVALTWLDGGPVYAETASAGNSIYTVHVERDAAAGGAGTFAISTGPEHPAGEGLSLLYPGEGSFAPGSYITVRSYTTGTDYVQSSGIRASGNLVVALDDYAQVEAIGRTGFRTPYDLPGPPGSAESLRIVSEVNVNGDTYADSSVAMSVTVTNQDVVPIAIGIRYLLDLEVAGDDGPVLIPLSPLSPAISRESSFANPGFAAARFDDNSGTDPRLSVLTTVAGDYPGIAPNTSQSDLLQYAYWSEAEVSAFDYDTRDRDIAAPDGLDDSALLAFFGATEGKAMLLPPGESLVVSVSMFATPGVTGPERCDNASDDDGDRLVDGEDADCQESGSPGHSPAAPGPDATPASLPRTGRVGSGHSQLGGLGAATTVLVALATVTALASRRPRAH
jgi:hypothetical protein